MSSSLSREQNTIAAISTGSGGGIGMIRLSGPESIAITSRIFRPQNKNRPLESLPGYNGS